MFEALARAYRGDGGVGRATSSIITLPPPIGGWNARDAVTEVSAVKTSGQQVEALLLDNWIPQPGGLQVRGGYESHVTALTGTYVETLMPYIPDSGSSNLFAATPTRIYDVTTAGAPAVVGAPTVFTNGRWSHVNYSNSTGNYLYIANGADAPRYFNGTTWTDSAFTGVTLANLDYVHAHMFRLWFIEKDTLNVWYGPIAGISGTLSKLDLGPLARRGGRLVAISSWTRDGGSGPDDYLVFITSEGEVIIYAGTDPDSITTSALVGVYPIAAPVGRRCLVSTGADMAVVTVQGLVSLSQVLALSEGAAVSTAISNKISGAFRTAARGSGSNFGWQIIEFPNEELIIVNVPIAERGGQHQYVMNLPLGSWCRFKGMEAGCWALFGGSLYFGGNDGAVYKYGIGSTNAGTPIIAEMQTAFSTFGSPGIKRFTMARPLFLAPAAFLPKVMMRVNYDTSPASLDTSYSETAGAIWDVAVWDEALWDGGPAPVHQWQGVYGEGVSGSVAFAVGSATELIYNGVDVMFEMGGPL